MRGDARLEGCETLQHLSTLLVPGGRPEGSGRHRLPVLNWPTRGNRADRDRLRPSRDSGAKPVRTQSRHWLDGAKRVRLVVRRPPPSRGGLDPRRKAVPLCHGQKRRCCACAASDFRDESRAPTPMERLAQCVVCSTCELPAMPKPGAASDQRPAHPVLRSAELNCSTPQRDPGLEASFQPRHGLRVPRFARALVAPPRAEPVGRCR